MWQCVAGLFICGLFGLNPLAMIPSGVVPVLAIMALGCPALKLSRRLAKRVGRVQRAKNREFGPTR